MNIQKIIEEKLQEFKSNPVVSEFVETEALNKVAADIREKTGGGTTAEGVKALMMSKRNPAIVGGVMKLRDYQKNFITSAVEALRGKDRIIGEAATGAGKSLMLAGIVSELDGDCIILSRQQVIAEQNYKHCKFFDGVRPALITKSVPPSGVFNCYVTTEGIAANRIDQIAKLGIKYILCDEAHQVPYSNPNSQYMQIIKRLDAKVLGVTGSPVRGNGTTLADSGWWHPEYFASIHADDLIERSYLTEYVVKSENVDAISEIVLDEEQLISATRHFVKSTESKYCNNIVFAKNKSDCRVIKAEVESMGHECVFIDGTTSEKRRAEIIKQEPKYIVNIDLCSTGWDIPRLGQLAWMRKMGSAILAIQSLGRILRLHPKKDKATAYDYCNVFTTNRSYFRKRMVDESLFNYGRGRCNCGASYTTINGHPIEPQCFDCNAIILDAVPIIADDHELYDDHPIYLFNQIATGIYNKLSVDPDCSYNSCDCSGNILTRITKSKCRACDRVLGEVDCVKCRKSISSNTSSYVEEGGDSGFVCRSCIEPRAKTDKADESEDERKIKYVRLSKNMASITIAFSNPIIGCDEIFRASFLDRETGEKRSIKVGALILTPPRHELSRILYEACDITYINALSEISKKGLTATKKDYTFKAQKGGISIRDIKLAANEGGWL